MPLADLKRSAAARVAGHQRCARRRTSGTNEFNLTPVVTEVWMQPGPPVRAIGDAGRDRRRPLLARAATMFGRPPRRVIPRLRRSCCRLRRKTGSVIVAELGGGPEGPARQGRPAGRFRGSRTQQDAPNADARHVRCVWCGGESPVDARLCTSCGRELSPTAAETPTDSVAPGPNIWSAYLSESPQETPRSDRPLPPPAGPREPSRAPGAPTINDESPPRPRPRRRRPGRRQHHTNRPDNRGRRRCSVFLPVWPS